MRTRTRRAVLAALDSRRFWVMACTLLAFGAMVLAGYTYYELSSDRAARKATAAATENAALQLCLRSISSREALGNYMTADLLYSEMVAAAIPSDVIDTALTRLKRARLEGEVALPVPTRGQCVTYAAAVSKR